MVFTWTLELLTNIQYDSLVGQYGVHMDPRTAYQHYNMIILVLSKASLNQWETINRWHHKNSQLLI